MVDFVRSILQVRYHYVPMMDRHARLFGQRWRPSIQSPAGVGRRRRPTSPRRVLFPLGGNLLCIALWPLGLGWNMLASRGVAARRRCRDAARRTPLLLTP